jgi:hypothetical protein
MMARAGRDARRSGTPSPRGFARKQSKRDRQTAPKRMNFLFRLARWLLLADASALAGCPQCVRVPRQKIQWSNHQELGLHSLTRL